ncbi:MAG TPA: TonB-dependent receptor [Steroidobacteraceae bacterium]|nr:TonB-dependent receptor [Steroidobacteraceae bacterium]
MSHADGEMLRQLGQIFRYRRLLLCLTGVMVLHAAAAADVTDMSLEQLLQISVVGASKYEQKQSQIGAAVTVITRQEIRAFGWRTLDQALASLPGVYVTYDRQFTYLGVRGFGLPGDYNTRVLVTINGNRVNDPIFDSGPSGRELPLDLDLIERIEFIPGPGGAVYGQNAMFAVVNIVTRTGAEMHGAEAAVGYQEPQSLIEGRASWGGRLDNGVDVLMSVSDMNAQGQNLFFDYGASGKSGVARGLDGDRSEQFFGSIARGPWSFEVVYGFEHKDDPTAAYLSDPLVPGQYQETGYALTQLQYQDKFAGDTLHASVRLFTGNDVSDEHLSFGTIYAYPSTPDLIGVEARLVSTALGAHILMLGLEAQDNYNTSQSQIVAAKPALDGYVPGSGYRVGLYGQDEWHISNALAATLGLRVDNNDTTGTALSPRLAFIWQATPETTAKALYGVAHRAPNAFEDLASFEPDTPSLRLSDETIDTLEFDVDHRVGRDLTLRASVYQWTLHDLILENDLTQLYQNTQPVDTRGIELSTDKTWDSGARLRDSVSIQHANYRSGGEVPNSPEILGKLNFSSPLPVDGVRLGYELRYDSSRLTLNGTPLGGYALSNLFLSTESLARGLEISLGVGNLFDKHYAQPASANHWQNSLEQDGRSVRVDLHYAR